MNLRSKLVRLLAVGSSLTLLTGYVIYSHVTPNVPPPDPLGLSEIDLTLDPTVVSINSFIEYDGAGLEPPKTKQPRDELRIITSKNISQPIFSTRKVSSIEVDDLLQVRADRRLMHGSKSGLVELPMPEFLNVTFADFGIDLQPFLGFPSPNDPFRGTSKATVKANDPFGAPASKP